MSGVVSMCLSLAVISKEEIKSLLIRNSVGVRSSQSPFAHATGYITILLQHPAECNSASRDGILSFKRRIFFHFDIIPDCSPFGPLVIPPDEGVSAVLSCE